MCWTKVDGPAVSSWSASMVMTLWGTAFVRSSSIVPEPVASHETTVTGKISERGPYIIRERDER